ncbi:hypothetical protein [Pseudonocardia sp.]|uniref:hypothetical protein n=1 Tax=Pseudonocardia sp. TaxID=60912 RepID=UPI003D0D35A9
MAIALASGTFLITALTMSEAAFVSWGWRIPFLAGVVLVGVGPFVRLRLEETHAFRQSTGRAKLPVAETLVRRPREVVLGAFVVTSE